MSTSNHSWSSALGRWGDRLGSRRRSKGIKPPKTRSPRLEQFEQRLLLNISPSITGPDEINEGSLYTLQLSVEAGSDAVTQWTIAWGDEAGDEPLTVERPGDGYPLYWGGGITRVDAHTWEARHKYAADGPYTIRATATDEDGTWDVDSASGTLDAQFGQGGWVIEDFGLTYYSYGTAMLVQPDGKILVAGYCNYDFAMVRYNSDGTLDTGFGTGGRVTTNLGGSDVCKAVALQSDGKILLAGYRDSDVALVRYTADGQLDNSFGTGGNGIVIQSFSEYAAGSDLARCLTVLPDDSIILGGWTEIGTPGVAPAQYDVLFAKFTTDGVWDASFNSGQGKLTFSSTTQYSTTGNVYDSAYAIDILWQRDNPEEIILAAAGDYHSNHGLFFFNDSGEVFAPNTSEGADGVVEQHIGYGSDAAYDLVIDRGSSEAELDDTIVICGYAYGGSGVGCDFSLARFTDDGALDTTLDTDGKMWFDYDAGHDYANGMAILPNGQLVTAGMATIDGVDKFDFALSCHDWSGGAPDADFGTGGRVTMDYGDDGVGADKGLSIAIDQDGNILVAGYATVNGSTRLALARVLSPLSGHKVTVHPLANTGTISGTVFEDSDRDGIFDIGEDRDDDGIVDVGESGSEEARTVTLQRIDSDAELLQSLLEPQRWAEESFGSHVAACGDNVLISSQAGSSQVVYLFEAATGLLLRTFEDPVAGGSFGSDVVAAGGCVYIADRSETVSGQASAGVVYVFDAQTGGYLGQFGRRNPTTGAVAPVANDNFGASLAILDGNLVVGVPGDDFGGANKGAVHLVDSQTGANLRTFVRSDPDPEDIDFGWSVAADAGRVVAGAYDIMSTGPHIGAAHVFDVETGQEEAVFENPWTTSASTLFGYTVAILGEKVLVGAGCEPDDVGGPVVGAVYLYDLVTSECERITNPLSSGRFGYSVSTHQDGFLVGDRNQGRLYRLDATTGVCSGLYTVPEDGWDSTGAYFASMGEGVVVGLPFAIGDQWFPVGAADLVDETGQQVRRFENPAEEAGSYFGQSVAALGSSVVVGAPRADGYYGEYEDTGAVFVLDSATGQLKLSIDNPAIEDNDLPTPWRDGFGSCVTTWNGKIVVGAPEADRFFPATQVVVEDVGAVYVFDPETGQRHTILSPNPDDDDRFGVSLAAQGDYLLIGADSDYATGCSGSGAVYVYRFGEYGDPIQRIHNPAGCWDDDFGHAVAWIGNDLLVGAPLSDISGAENAGVVYRFAFDEENENWIPTSTPAYAKLFPSMYDWFGSSLAVIDGDILIGAPGDGTLGVFVGAAYLFDGEDGQWLRTFLPPSPTDVWLGALTVAAAGNGRLVLASWKGAAYLFDSTTGALLQTFANPKGAELQYFGLSAAVVGDACEAVALGAAYDDQAAVDAGAVYVFDTGYRTVTTVQDGDGSYSFTGLLPGKYLVRQVLPSGCVGSCPADPRGYVITLGVTDRGLVGSEAFVDFGSYEPAEPGVVIVRGDTSVPEGALYAIEVLAPGIDVHHWVVNWGDGTDEEEFPGYLPVLTHTYASSTAGQSPHEIVVTAVDVSQGQPAEHEATETPTVEVTAVAPTLSGLPDRVVRPNTSFSFEALFTDPCLTGGLYKYDIDWGDGQTFGPEEVMLTGSSGSFSGTHAYNTLNAEGYAVRVTLYDPLYLPNDDSRQTLLDVVEFKVIVAEMGPVVTQASPTGMLLGPVSQVLVSFDRAIDNETLDTEDVTLTGPTGSIAIADVDDVGNDQFLITFASQSAAGTYILVVGPSIEDSESRPMNQDGDAVNGEPEDAYTLTFKIIELAPEDRPYQLAEDGLLVVTASDGLLVEEGLDSPAGWTAALHSASGSAPEHGELYPAAYDTSGQPVFGTPLGPGVSIPDGAFFYKPDEDFCGEDTFTYVLVDPLQQETEVVSVTLTVQPDSLVIEGPTSQSAAAGLWTSTVTVGDEDSEDYVWPNDSLNFSLDPGCPSGAAVNAAGEISWAVPSNVHGKFLFTVRAADDGEPALTDVKTFEVSVGDANTAPGGSLATVSFPTFTEGTQGEVNVSTYVSDPDVNDPNDPDHTTSLLQYRLGPNAPRGAAIGSSGLFTWTPAEDQDGVHPITIEVIHRGNPPMKISHTFTVTVNEVNDPPGPPSLALANDTKNGEEGGTGDPTIEGWVTNDGSFGLVAVEFDFNEDDTCDAVAAVDAEGYFSVVPPVDPGSTSPATITARARTREWDTEEEEFQYSSDWENASSLTVDYLKTYDGAPSISSSAPLALANDTGTSSQDQVTWDPTLTGVVTNDGRLEGLMVEFQLATRTDQTWSDWQSIGSVQTDAEGLFTFRREVDVPTGSANPNVRVRARAVENGFMQVLSSDWGASTPGMIEFTLVENAAPEITNLNLLNDTGEVEGRTSDPTIEGNVSHSDGPTAGLIVQFYQKGTSDPDPDGDTVPDGQVVVPEGTNGDFTYTPLGLEAGSVTVWARVVELDPLTGQIVYQSGWTDSYTFTLDYAENLAPAVTASGPNSLKLKSDTGVFSYDNRTADPTVTGTVTDDGELAGIWVELDLDYQEGQTHAADAFVLTDEEGRFSYTPIGLQAGPVTVYARAVEWDPHLASPLQQATWVAVSFTLDPAETSTYVVSTFGLLYDSGGEGEDADRQTNDPTVTGTVSLAGTQQGTLEGTAVAISHCTGDQWTRIGTTFTDEDGHFTFAPPRGRFTGGQTVRLRAELLEWDTYGEPETTSMRDLTFALFSTENVLPWLVGTLVFDVTREENTTAPRLRGEVANDGPVEGLTVQYGVPAGQEWTVLGETTTDAQGEFVFSLEDLVPGQYEEIEVRFGERTYLDTGMQFSAAESVSISRTADEDLAVPSLALKRFRVDGDTTLVFDPIFVGEGVTANSTVEWTVQFNYDADEALDGWTTLDGLGQFEYRPEALGLAGDAVRVRARLVGSSDAEHWVCGAWSDELPFTLEASTVAIEEVRLLRDTGEVAGTLDGWTCDPTICGRVVEAEGYAGLNELAGLLVTFAISYNGADWSQDGMAMTDADGRFTYVPSGLREGGSVVAATLVSNPSMPQGEPGVGWETLCVTLESPGAAAIATLELEYSLSSEDSTCTDPTLTGSISNSGQYGQVVIEFDHNANDEGFTVDGTAVCDQDGDFVYMPQGLPFSSVQIRARARVWDYVTGKYVYSECATEFSTTHAYDVDVTLLASASMLSFAGISRKGELVGVAYVDPTIVGEVDVISADVTPLWVEIDHGTAAALDGTPDGRAEIVVEVKYDETTGAAESCNTFEYLPEGLPLGDGESANNVTLKVRPVGWNEDTGQYVYGDWSSELSFDYQPSAPEVDSLEILDGNGDSVASGSSAVGPITLAGRVTSQRGGPVTVELDYVFSENSDDLDGVADASVPVCVDGTFTFVPEDFGEGPITFRARAVEVDAATGLTIRGAWTMAQSRTIAARPSLIVTDLALVNDTGVAGDGETSDPTIQGVVTSADGQVEAYVYVAVDLDGDHRADDLTMTDELGAFSYRPADRPAQTSLTVSFRAVGSDFHAKAEPGEWTPFTLTYVPVAPPVVESIELLHDTGQDDGDRITADPTLSGTVSYDAAAGYAIVEFDLNGDDLVDGGTILQEDGGFVYTPDVDWGKSTVRARGVLLTDTRTVEGAWKEIEITLAPDEQPSVTGLVADSETGTITGRARLDGYGLPLVVQFDCDDDGVPDGSVEADADGWFTYTPTELAAGEVTIYVRAILGNTELADDSGIGWTPCSFTYSPAQISGTPSFDTLNLLYDTGEDDDDRVTADPTIQIQLKRTGSPVGGLKVEVQVRRWLDGQQPGGWIPAGTVLTDASGAATLVLMDRSDEDSPAVLPLGEIVGSQLVAYEYDVQAQVSEWNPAEGGFYAEYGWVQMSTEAGTFQLDPSENVAATVSFALQADTPPGTVKGTVSNPDGPVGWLLVQFDHGEDGTLDGTARTAADGSFLYVPVRIGLGSTSAAIGVSVPEFDYFAQQFVAGEAETFMFTTPEPKVPEILDFQLLADTGVSQGDGNTSNPAVIGLVDYSSLFDQNLFQYSGDPDDLVEDLVRAEWGPLGLTVTIEASVGEDLITGTTKADKDGRFVYAMSELKEKQLAPGTEITVRARVEATDSLTQATIQSDWTPLLSFNLFNSLYTDETNTPNGNKAPWIATELGQLVFALVEDTGDPNGQTSNPTVRGRVANDGSAAGLTVQIGLFDPSIGQEGDYEVIGTATTNAGGEFVFTPFGLPCGNLQIGARPVEIDPMASGSGPELVGQWQSVMFTLVAAGSVLVTSLSLKTDTDGGGTEPDLSTTDPTLIGTVSSEDDARIAGLLVEFDFNDDEVADGATVTDASGGLEFKPIGLSPGPVTVRTRVREWDYATGSYTDPDWAADQTPGHLTFTLEPEAPASNETIAESLDYFASGEEMMRTAVFDAIVATTNNTSNAIYLGETPGSVDVGVGAVNAYYRGGAQILDGEDPALHGNTPVALFQYLPTGRNSSASSTQITLPGSGTPPVTATYSGHSVVTAGDGVCTIDIYYTVSFEPFSRTQVYTTEEDGITTLHTVTETLSAASYTFDFDAMLYYYEDDGFMFIDGGDSDLTESAEFTYSYLDSAAYSGSRFNEILVGTSNATGSIDFDYTYTDDGAFTRTDNVTSSSHVFTLEASLDLAAAVDGSSSSTYLDGDAQTHVVSNLHGRIEYEASVVIPNPYGTYAITYGTDGQSSSFDLDVDLCPRHTSASYELSTDAIGSYQNAFSGGSESGTISLASSESYGESFSDVADYHYSRDDETLFASFGSHFTSDQVAGASASAAIAGTFSVRLSESGSQGASEGSYSSSAGVAASLWRFAQGEYSESYSLDLDPQGAEPVVNTSLSATLEGEDHASLGASATESFSYWLSDKYGRLCGSAEGTATLEADYLAILGGTLSLANDSVTLDLSIKESATASLTASGGGLGAETYTKDGNSEQLRVSSDFKLSASGLTTRDYAVRVRDDDFEVAGLQSANASAEFHASSSVRGSFVDKRNPERTFAGVFQSRVALDAGVAHLNDEAAFLVTADSLVVSGSYEETTYLRYNGRYDLRGGISIRSPATDPVTVASDLVFTFGGRSTASTAHCDLVNYVVTDDSISLGGTFHEDILLGGSGQLAYTGRTSRSKTTGGATGTTELTTEVYAGTQAGSFRYTGEDQGQFSTDGQTVKISGGQFTGTETTTARGASTSTVTTEKGPTNNPDAAVVLSTERDLAEVFSFSTGTLDAHYETDDADGSLIVDGTTAGASLDSSLRQRQTTLTPLPPEDLPEGSTFETRSTTSQLTINWAAGSHDGTFSIDADGDETLDVDFTDDAGSLALDTAFESISTMTVVGTGSMADVHTSKVDRQATTLRTTAEHVTGNVSGPDAKVTIETASHERSLLASSLVTAVLTGPESRSETSRTTIVLGREWETLGPPPEEAGEDIQSVGTFGRIASRTDTVEVQGASSTAAGNSSSTHLTDSAMTELLGSKEEGTFTIASGKRTNLSTRTRWEGSRGHSLDIATSSRSDPKTVEFSLDTSVIDVWHEVTRKLNNGKETGEGSSVDRGYTLVTNWKLASTERTENAGSNEYTLRGSTEENRLLLRKHHEHRTLCGGVDAIAFYSSRREDSFAATAVESTRCRTTDSTSWTESSGASLASRHTQTVSTALQIGSFPRVEVSTVADQSSMQTCIEKTYHHEVSGSGQSFEEATIWRLLAEESSSSSDLLRRLTTDEGRKVIGGFYADRAATSSACHKEKLHWSMETLYDQTISEGASKQTEASVQAASYVDAGVLLGGPADSQGGVAGVSRAGCKIAHVSGTREGTYDSFGWSSTTGPIRESRARRSTLQKGTMSVYGPGGVRTATTGRAIERYHDEYFGPMTEVPLTWIQIDFLQSTDLATDQTKVLVNRRSVQSFPSEEGDGATDQYFANLGSVPYVNFDSNDQYHFGTVAPLGVVFHQPGFLAIPLAGGPAGSPLASVSGAPACGSASDGSSGSKPPAAMPLALRATPPRPASPLDAAAQKAYQQAAGQKEGGTPSPADPTAVQTITITQFGCVTTYIDAPGVDPQGGFWSGVSDVAFRIGLEYSVQFKNAWVANKAFLNAYLETALSGEQASSLCGYVDGLTDSLNPFGGGTWFGPKYGKTEAYDTGTSVGHGAGIAINAVLLVSGIRGVVVGIQTIRASGGLLEVGVVALADGRTVPVIVGVSGGAIELTADVAASAGISAEAYANLQQALSSAHGPGGGGPNGPLHHYATNKNWISTLRGGPWSPRFEAIFKRAGMTLEDAANTGNIPGHFGPHSEAYHAEIYRRLWAATDGLTGPACRKALLQELEAIGLEARTPGSLLHRLLTGGTM